MAWIKCGVLLRDYSASSHTPKITMAQYFCHVTTIAMLLALISSTTATSSTTSSTTSSATTSTSTSTTSSTTSSSLGLVAELMEELGGSDTDSSSSSDTLSESSSDETSNISPETSVANSWPQDACYDEPLLQTQCTVPTDMDDVIFWDLYSILFSDSVLDALILGCPKGTWCLKDKLDEWEGMIAERAEMVLNSEIASSMCQPDMVTCVNHVSQAYRNCSVFAQMEYTAQSIKLVCDLKNDPSMTSECLKHALTSLHVTLADVIRMDSNVEPVGQTDDGDFCKSPEAHMTQGLLCMYNSCPNHADDFTQFVPWSWFTSVVDDVIAECGLDPNNCISLIQVGDIDSNVSSLTSPSQQSMTSSEPSLTSVFLDIFDTFTSSAMTTSSYKSSSNDVTSPESHVSDEDTDQLFNYPKNSDVNQPFSNVMYRSDVKMMAGIAVATLVSAVVLLALLCVVYRRHQRNVVVKEGYQKLLNDNEDS